MKAKFKQFFSIFSNESVRYYFLAFLLCLIMILILDFFIADEQRGKAILVEAHGMLMDILVLGVFLAIYDHFREKRNKIERYKEEIDDFKEWNEMEASHRIAGNIRRLNKEGLTKLNLSNCFLSNAYLQEIQLQGANLSYTILSRAHLYGANLTKSIMWHTDLQYALINQAFLEEADLWLANLQGVQMADTNLRKANLNEANLKDAILYKSDFQSADLRGAYFHNTDMSKLKSLDLAKVDSLNWFQHLRENVVQGIDEIESKYFIDSTPHFDENKHIYYLIKKQELTSVLPVSKL